MERLIPLWMGNRGKEKTAYLTKSLDKIRWA